MEYYQKIKYLARVSSMTSSTVFARLADAAHKVAIVGLMGMAGYHVAQITRNVRQGQHVPDQVDSTYFKKVDDKIKEEFETKYGKTNYRDWYDKDDDSYRKNVPRPNPPRREQR